MNEIIKIAIIGILLNLNAQCIVVKTVDNKVSEIKAENKYNPNIKSSGTKFAEGLTQKKWSSSTGDNFFSATFSKFTGKSYVELEILKPMSITLNHSISLSNGKITMELENSKSNNILLSKIINGSSKESTTLNIDNPGLYFLTMKGENAQGNYFCEWIELQ